MAYGFGPADGELSSVHGDTAIASATAVAPTRARIGIARQRADSRRPSGKNIGTNATTGTTRGTQPH